MKKAIRILSISCGIAVFADVNAVLRSFVEKAVSHVGNFIKQNQSHPVFQSAGSLLNTAVMVGTTVAQQKAQAAIATAQSAIIQPFITKVKDGAAALQQSIMNHINSIRGQEQQIIAQENALIAQAQAQTPQVQTPGAPVQVPAGTQAQISLLEQQRQLLEQQVAALTPIYNTALGQINNLVTVVGSGDPQRITREVPQLVNQIITTLANTPLRGTVEQILTQSVNSLVAEAEREINNQNTNLQNQYVTPTTYPTATPVQQTATPVTTVYSVVTAPV
ncbi:MAG: hypothetical protein LBJ71_02205 [Holosporaceae bacterium]|nr:hypothetical protein [Holosporaceae bacterium]